LALSYEWDEIKVVVADWQGICMKVVQNKLSTEDARLYKSVYDRVRNMIGVVNDAFN
jgi:hypothetical protein